MAALALILAATGAAAASTPPRQTAVQRALLAELEPRAAAASAAATPRVLALLGSDAFKAGLAACCPTIASKTPAELLALLEAEVAVAELTHNFAPINDSWENDVSIATLGNATYFYNLWELSFLGLGRKNVVSTHGILNFVCGLWVFFLTVCLWVQAVDGKNGEVNLLGFPPFTNGTQPATLDEAAQRPVYTTVAMLNSGLGNPTFGGVSAVFSNRNVANMSVIAPADTGNYEAACNLTGGHPPPGTYFHHFSVQKFPWIF